jgi:hypothetical protein
MADGHPYLDHFVTPTGGVYHFHDVRLDNLNELFHVSSANDGSDTPKDVQWDKNGTTITGTLEANTDIAHKYIYLVYSPNDDSDDRYDEYVAVETTPGSGQWYWEKFTSTDIHIHGLYGSYTPEGLISQPTFAGTPSTISVPTTPAGTVSQPEFTGTPATVNAMGTPQITPATANVGFECSVSGTTLTLSTVNVITGVAGAPTTFQGGYTPTGTVSQPTFTGTPATVDVDYTPGGTVSTPTFTGTPATIVVN